MDTLTESFGEILLNPNTGKALQSGLLDVWYAGWLEDKLGVTAFHHLGRGYIGETPISLTVEGGPSLRYLAGDVTNVPDDVRSAILGTTDRTFFGFEMGFSLVFGTLSGALHYYGFPGGDDPLVGLTSGQVTVGFQVAGHVLSGYLGDQPEAREREAAGAEIPVPGH